MKINRILLALTLALPSSFAVLTPANLLAQTTNPALNAFQVTVPININNFNFTPVTIPAGYRLVIQDVSLSGAAQTTGAYVQPIAILSSTLSSEAANLRYFAPNPSATVPGQYYGDYPTAIRNLASKYDNINTRNHCDPLDRATPQFISNGVRSSN